MKVGKDPVSDPEFAALYRIARRNGFLAADLEGRSVQNLAALIACRDRGHFPRMLAGRTGIELEAILASDHHPPVEQ